mmetsp:Transcript_17089/g.49383  ORF Transcript_17089/g.49383 Transcript_17089/m.49383 type:complete len:263 (-) Transcript_17089:354-1142(-)
MSELGARKSALISFVQFQCYSRFRCIHAAHIRMFRVRGDAAIRIDLYHPLASSLLGGPISPFGRPLLLDLLPLGGTFPDEPHLLIPQFPARHDTRPEGVRRALERPRLIDAAHVVLPQKDARPVPLPVTEDRPSRLSARLERIERHGRGHLLLGDVPALEVADRQSEERGRGSGLGWGEVHVPPGLAALAATGAFEREGRRRLPLAVDVGVGIRLDEPRVALLPLSGVHPGQERGRILRAVSAAVCGRCAQAGISKTTRAEG